MADTEPALQYVLLQALALAGGYSNTPGLSQISSVFLLSACTVLRDRNIWQTKINPISDTEYESVLELIEQAEGDLMSDIGIGSIGAFLVPPTTGVWLPMDGTTVPEASYPQLSAMVPVSWKSAGTITLPDMGDAGIFGAGAGTAGAIIGENTTAITEAQMPAHTHVQNPHSHAYSGVIITPSLAGLEPGLASLVAPSPAVTGPAVATNQSAGGGEPHNNVQRSLAVLWYIQAG